MVPTVLDRLSTLPAGQRLLGALDGTPGVHLVGGAVRDLLIGRTPHELDLLAEQDGPAVARALAERLGGELRVHQTFGTATVEAPGVLLDVATARAEDYPRPGALPVVRPGTLEEDMARRDFSVNAIAVGLSDDVRGRVTSYPGALEDLDARRLRVLHDGSFQDDPTRLIRLARYGTRLNLALDPRTEQLARVAFAEGAPETAGPARMGRELWLLLGEPSVVDALDLLRELGGLEGFAIDRHVLDEVLSLAGHVEHGRHALLAAIAPPDLERWLAEAHVPHPEIVLDAARDPAGLGERLRAAQTASQLAEAVRGRTPEAVAVAGPYAPAEADRWLGELRHARLEIGGADLLAAGVPQGPEVGRRLDRARDALLDGRAPTREAQLEVALYDL